MASADVVSLIMEDHEEARGALKSFVDADRSEWSAEFGGIADTLERHEAAEEAAVYPVLRDEVPGGGALADARLAEQSEAHSLIESMRAMPFESDEFADAVRRLRAAVLEHADAEEADVLPLLRERVDHDRLTEMGEYYTRVKAKA